MAQNTNGTSPRVAERGRRIAVEELTGLALQERALTALLRRHASETTGDNRRRLEEHARLSERHQQTFADLAQDLGEHRGVAEGIAGVVRSGLAAAGTIGAAAGQVLTLPLSALRQGGEHERELENAGVEGAGVANKLVILTAVRQALTSAGADEPRQVVERVREETVDAWDELLEQTPELMKQLVGAKAGETVAA